MRLGLFISLVAAVLTGCSENTFFKDADTPEGSEPGTILGRVCDPSGRHWLPDAMAYANLIDGSGKLYDTRKSYTDRDGYFLLDDMPSGSTYTVYIQFGGEVLETHSVEVGGGEEVVLEEPDCFDPLDLDVAVVTGDYDEFQDVLNHMGFANYELVDGLHAAEMAGFLMDLDKMLLYDIIIFNGGHVEEGLIYPVPPDDDDDEDADGGPGSIFDDTGDPPDDPVDEGDDTGSGDDTGGEGGETGPEEPTYAYEVIINNLRAYVAAGGAVYASDWAYDVVEQAWPEAIDFVGADEVPDAAQLGEYGIVTATVADGALATWLESDYTQVEFDLPVWPPIEGVSDTVSIHLTGSIDYRQGINIFHLANSPLLVSFTSGDGKVAFSTFRVANNADSDIVLTLQYMMYSL
jgi:hypothetical protein